MAARLDPTWLLWPLLAIVGAALGLLAGYQPALAIAVALGIGFMLLVLADLTAGLVGFTVIAFLGLVPSFAGPALSLPKLAGLALAISWLATVATRGEEASRAQSAPPSLVVLPLLFGAWTALSVIWSESHWDAVSSTYRFALNLALFPIMFAAIRTRRHAVWVAAAFVAGTTIAAAYGLVLRPDASEVGAGLTGSAELARVSGTLGDPNELAAVLVAGIILATGLVRIVGPSPAPRIALLGAAGLCMATLFLTLSRGGLVALGAALIAGILLGGRWRSTYALVAVTALAAGAIYFTGISERAGERISTADGGTGRTDIWKVGWRIVEDKPILGAGAGNFPEASIHYVLAPGPLRRSDLIVEEEQVAHNTYLGLLAELGIVGLALFGAIVATAIGLTLKAAAAFRRGGEADMELLARAAVIALIGMLAAAFFLSSEYSKQLWLLLAFGPALLALARRPVEAET